MLYTAYIYDSDYKPSNFLKVLLAAGETERQATAAQPQQGSFGGICILSVLSWRLILLEESDGENHDVLHSHMKPAPVANRHAAYLLLSDLATCRIVVPSAWLQHLGHSSWLGQRWAQCQGPRPSKEGRASCHCFVDCHWLDERDREVMVPVILSHVVGLKFQLSPLTEDHPKAYGQAGKLLRLWREVVRLLSSLQIGIGSIS